MDVEALTKRLDEEWLAKSRSSFDCPECGLQANFIAEIRDALAALSADLSMANAAAETARASSDHWEARAKEMEKERDDIKATLKYCEGCWSDERGTMIDMMKAAKARVAELERDSNRWWKWGVRDKARAEAAEARATTLAAEVERMRKALTQIRADAGTADFHIQEHSFSSALGFLSQIRSIARAALEGKDNDRHC